MKVIIAGTVHQDPLCRLRLREMFAELQERGPSPPQFIAVEADADHFAQIRASREKFKSEARSAWPEVPAEVIDHLAATMLYEGDTHLEFFPEAGVIWLDRDRALPQPDAVSRFAELRLACYQPLIEKRKASNAGFEASSRLRYLSSAAKLGVRDGPPDRDPARDARWFAEMAQGLDKASQDDWAVVVCGAEHGRIENGNIAELLFLAGHEVECRDLVGAVS